MKPLLIFNFIFYSFLLTAQVEIINFYQYNWQPTIYNPGFQSKEKVAFITSFSNWRKGENFDEGFLNIGGGFSIPNKKKKIRWGLNYFSFQTNARKSGSYHNYHSKEVGLFFNQKLYFAQRMSFTYGAELGLRSQNYFLEEARFNFGTGQVFRSGYHNKNTSLLNVGFILSWRYFYFGLSCRNCTSNGFSDLDGFSDRAMPIMHFQIGYHRTYSEKFTLKVDGFLRGGYYSSLSSISFAGIFSKKYSLGFTLQGNYHMNTVCHTGFKWKNIWLLGAFQPSNTYDSASFELMAKMELENLNLKKIFK